MKLKILDSLHNPDLISNAFKFLKNKRKLQLIKYSKKYQKKLNISIKDYMSYNNSIILFSAENEKFIIDKKAAKRSGLLKNCIEDDENFKELNLIDIDSKFLKIIIEFLEHYKDSEPQLPQSPLQDSNVMQYLDEWSKIFFSKLNLEDIISLINASNYMDIKSLIKICSAIIASSMIDLPIEEVEKIFGIESDLTEEEMKEFDLYPIE